MSNSKNNSNTDSTNDALWLVGGVVFMLVATIVSCSDNNNGNVQPVSRVPAPVNDYQDMRNRGHSEEDAVIFGILKQQGYNDYDAIRATQSSKEKAR